MKKLIAISVMLALVAGAAFAELTFGGGATFSWVIAQGDDNDDAAMFNGTSGSGVLQELKFSMSQANDEGTFRSKLVLQWDNERGATGGKSSGDITTSSTASGSDPAHSHTVPGARQTPVRFNSAFVVWKPIPQVEFFYGVDGDGKFQSANLTRYGFGQGGQGGVANENWNGHRYLIGGWDGAGVAVSLMPVDFATVNVVVNLDGRENGQTGEINGFEWKDIGDNIMLQLDLTIPNDIGKLWVTYWNIVGQSANGYFWPYGGASAGNQIGVTYYNDTFVDGLAFEVGGTYRTEKAAETNPFKFGVGVSYTGGDWGVKARGLFNYNDASNMDTITGRVDIMPWYNFGIVEARCDVKIYLNNGYTGWMINPYILHQVGVGRIAAGLKVFDKIDSNTSNTSWQIPVAFIVGL